MPILAAELKTYQSTNMPENDITASGGAINTAGTVDELILAANDTLRAASSVAGDTTQTITITGRNAAGAIVSQAVALTGTTQVALATNTFERIMKVVLSASAAGTVTVYRSNGTTVVVTMAPGITSVRRMFYDSASESGVTIRYEKIFKKNTHATLTLTNAQLTLTADTQNRYRLAVATSLDDSVSVAHRKTVPGGLTFVDDAVAQNVPTGMLPAGAALGVWVEENLPVNDPAFKNTITTQLSGTTT